MRLRRGSEVEAGELGEQSAIGFLGEGVQQVVGAQARLHMANGNLLVEGGQAGRKGGGGVPLHQHQLRGVGLEIIAKALQRGAGHMREGLAWSHQVQILISR